MGAMQDPDVLEVINSITAGEEIDSGGTILRRVFINGIWYDIPDVIWV